MAVHANFIFMPRALPLGELDAKRPERASTLTIYSWNEVFYMYTIKTLNAISPVGLAKLPKNQFDVTVDADEIGRAHV